MRYALLNKTINLNMISGILMNHFKIILKAYKFPIRDLYQNIVFFLFKKCFNEEYNYKYSFIHGDLTKWSSREKILLLNTSLTIGSKKYWRKYTDLIIKEISENTNHICFVLMGNHAKSKKHLIDENKHYIIECIHPSPNSASRGFFGSNIFRKIEKYVGSIDWQN